MKECGAEDKHALPYSAKTNTIWVEYQELRVPSISIFKKKTLLRDSYRFENTVFKSVILKFLRYSSLSYAAIIFAFIVITPANRGLLSLDFRCATLDKQLYK